MNINLLEKQSLAWDDSLEDKHMQEQENYKS